MTEPFVSIIVPNYNHARFLKERLDSIFSQSYTNYEVIILDDYSKDDSMKIISDYANNPKVSHVVRNDTNSGSVFKQWKRGMSLAKGDIVWIAESDDYCDRDMLVRLVEAYVSHNCVLAFCRSMLVDVQGKPISVAQRMFKKDTYWNGKTFVRQYLGIGNRIRNASSVIFSKEAAFRVNPSYEKFKECGDWLLWIEIAIQGNVAVVSAPLNSFRRGEETCTSRATLSGVADKEDVRVVRYLDKKGLLSWLSKFVKFKRMAYSVRYQTDRYENEQIKQETTKALGIPYYYYMFAFFSHLLRLMFRKKR